MAHAEPFPGFGQPGSNRRKRRTYRLLNAFVTHRELDAKLEAVEARMDGRIARIEDSVRSIAQSVRDLRVDHRHMRQEMQDMRREVRTELHAMDQKISNFKSTILTTALVSVIAIVFGVGSFNATLMSNMMSLFEMVSELRAASPSPPAPPPAAAPGAAAPHRAPPP